MYVFDNAAPQAPARLGALAAVFDPGTIRQLEARGVSEGWKCLEVGGGLGTITRWLAARVGASGYVLTTDIDTRYLIGLQSPTVAIKRQDVIQDELPREVFDLAYMRLVLGHVSDPRRALANVIRAVRPGGWVLVEDFEVLPAGDAAPGSDVEPVSKTFGAMRQVVSAAGANMRIGRSLSQRLRAAGLEDVTAEGRVFLWHSGSDGATLMRMNADQLRDAILATGLVTAREYADDLAHLDTEAFEARSPILWTAWGRRPAP